MHRFSLEAVLLLSCLTLGLGGAAQETPRPARNDLLARAHELYRSGKFEDAIEAYRELFEINPSSSEAYAGIVHAYLKQEKIDQAFDVAQQGVTTAPEGSAAHSALGDVYFRKAEMSDSEKEYLKALKLNSRDARAHFGLSRIYHALSYYRRAYDELQIAHRLDPEDPDIQKSWMGTLSRSQRIALLEKYLSAPSNDDAEERAHLERYLEFMKARQQQPGKNCHLLNKVPRTETKLNRVMYDPQRFYGWSINVKINDRAANLTLDTGATGILINSKMAEKAGLKALSRSELHGIGDKGPATGYAAIADSIKIGELEFQNCIVEVSDKKSIVDASGLIGTDVFSDYLITLDFIAYKLKLLPLPERPEEQKAEPSGLKTGAEDDAEIEDNPESEKTTSASATKQPHLPKDRYIAPEMKNYSTVFRFGHELLISTRIGDVPPKLFLIDSGASMNTISPEAAREVTKVNKDTLTTVKGISGNVKQVFRANETTIQFGRYRQRNEEMIAFDMSRISKHTGTEVSGILGFPVLRLLEMKIDYRDGLVDFNFDPERLGLGKNFNAPR